MGLDFFRQASWLDRSRTRGYLVTVALLQIATVLLLIATSRQGIDRNGFLLGTDFLSFWTTGTMLHGGDDVYDPVAHAAAQRALFAQDGAHTAFFYPPTFLPFCWPLGLVGYFPALAVWLAATGAAYLFAVRRWLQRTGLSQPALLLVAAFPPVLISITHGQTSLLVAALLGIGTLLIRDRPWLAGALFGLATIKPQFGILIPLVLLLTREWRVIAGAGLSAALLGLSASVAFGMHIWSDWLALSGSAQAAMDRGAVGYAKMQSLLAAAMLLGVPAALAYALQIALSLTVAGALVWASWRRGFDLSLGALMLAAAPLATPFVLDYDMALLGFPLIWLAAQGFRPWEKLIFVLTFIAPIFARPLAMHAGIPIMPFILVAFFVVLLRRAAERPRRDKRESPTRRQSVRDRSRPRGSG